MDHETLKQEVDQYADSVNFLLKKCIQLAATIQLRTHYATFLAIRGAFITPDGMERLCKHLEPFVNSELERIKDEENRKD